MKYSIGNLEVQIFINCKDFIVLSSFGFELRQRSLLDFFVLDFIRVAKGIFAFLLTLLLFLCIRKTYVLLLFLFACCCMDLRIHRFLTVVTFNSQCDAFHILLIILLE